MISTEGKISGAALATTEPEAGFSASLVPLFGPLSKPCCLLSQFALSWLRKLCEEEKQPGRQHTCLPRLHCLSWHDPSCTHSKSTFHLNPQECLLVAVLALVSSTNGGFSCRTCHLSVVTMACSLASAEDCQQAVVCPLLRWSSVFVSMCNETIHNVSQTAILCTLR